MRKLEKEEKSHLLNIIFIGLGLVFLIIVWYILSACLKASGNRILEYPHETFYRCLALCFGKDAGQTWLGILNTNIRLFIGFAISIVLAAIFGTLSGLHGWLRSFFKPGIGLFKTIPTAAVVIILIGIMLGLGNKGSMNVIPIILTILVAFPILFEAFASGIENEKENIKDALRLESNLSSPKVIVSILWPDSWPYISLGIATSLGLSMKVTIMSEILSSSSVSKPGIGSLIVVARQEGTIENVIAYSVIVLAMMAIIDLPLIILKSKQKKFKQIDKASNRIR